MSAGVRGSLRIRLIAGAMAAMAAALLLAGLFIADLFAGHVRRTVEEDLTHHLSELVAQSRTTADGGMRVRGELSDPRFQEPGSGMTWRIDVPGRAPILSASSTPDRPAGARTVERTVRLVSEGRPTTFSIRADGRLLDAEIAAFRTDLALSLSALALLFAVALMIFTRYGLRPLEQLGEAADALRQGRRDRLPEDVPSEFRGLVTRLNELLTSQSVLVARGRLEAGNLAHALRTPLALIGDEAARLRDHGQPRTADFIAQHCSAMGRQIDYHMRRAAAGGTGQTDAPVPLAPMIDTIASALHRLHREPPRALHVTLPAGLAVQADAGDLFEMVSNLLDNAFKWAAGTITVAADEADGLVRLSIADDGPGIAAGRRDAVLRAGARLDETVAGHGLGLAIVADLAAMNGGGIVLDDGPAGGLRATLTLRAAGAG